MRFQNARKRNTASLLALAQVGIGVAKRAGIGVLGEEDEHTGLAPRALGDIVAFDARVRPVVGHGVEVEVERLGGEQRLLCEHTRCQAPSKALVGVVREEYSLR